MENTLQHTQAAKQNVELTPLGRVLLQLAILAGVLSSAWFAYQRYTEPAHVALVRADPAQAKAAGAAPIQSGPTAAQLTQELLREQRGYADQYAAWRAVSEADKQQIADLTTNLKALDSKIDVLQKMPPPTRVAAVHDVAAQSAMTHQVMNVASTVTAVDVSSLPLETISAQDLNVTGFGRGVVGIGSQQLTVGRELQPGETIVGIDPISKSIVTNRRIINVTN